MRMFYMTCGSLVTLLLACAIRIIDNPKDVVLNTLVLGSVLCAFMLLFIIAMLDDKLYKGELLGIMKEFREMSSKDKGEDDDSN